MKYCKEAMKRTGRRIKQGAGGKKGSARIMGGVAEKRISGQSSSGQ